MIVGKIVSSERPMSVLMNVHRDYRRQKRIVVILGDQRRSSTVNRGRMGIGEMIRGQRRFSPMRTGRKVSRMQIHLRRCSDVVKVLRQRFFFSLVYACLLIEMTLKLLKWISFVFRERKKKTVNASIVNYQRITLLVVVVLLHLDT